ncbi:hypothetical protein ACFWVP_27155 [Streptomyces sp. NPDC058637]|uniref:hypothetical protein n=1 Tax=Streptomyces sp. NPDC058637 TaxID=3346569 RepID=UPI00365D7CC6
MSTCAAEAAVLPPPRVKPTNGTTFKPSDHYGHTLDPAADVPLLLKRYAGPQANIGR